MIVLLSWIFGIIGVIGSILNLKKIKYCFILWGITNLAWIVIDLIKGIPGQAFNNLIMLVLAIWGWIEWNKKVISYHSDTKPLHN